MTPGRVTIARGFIRRSDEDDDLCSDGDNGDGDNGDSDGGLRDGNGMMTSVTPLMLYLLLQAAALSASHDQAAQASARLLQQAEELRSQADTATGSATAHTAAATQARILGDAAAAQALHEAADTALEAAD